MKKYIIPAIILGLVACNQNSQEALQEKLQKNKENIRKLTEENKKVQHKLDSINGEQEVFAVPVRLQKLETTEFKHFIQANGMIEAVEQAIISPETPGQVQQIHVREGEFVQKGQLLVNLNASVVINSIDEVKKGLELANDVYLKQEALWNKKIGSELQYLQAKNNKESLEKKLETLQAQLAMYRIKAPFGGIVDEVVSKIGELANPGYPVLHLVNLQQLKIMADVSEAFIPAVKKGDLVKLKFPTYPDMEREIRIFRTGNIIKKDNRTFSIELRLENIQNKLKPNMMAVIDINDYTLDSAIVVPSNIIKNDIRGQFLFVVEKDAKGKLIAKKKMVKPGRVYDGFTVISSGLKEGQQIIVEGFNTVSTNTPVKVK